MSQEQTAEPKKPAVFDAAKSFVVPILSGTEKRFKVRFPTDAEWCERARKQRSIRRFLGRGKSEAQDLDSDAIHLELFERIRQDQDGAPVDGPDAAAVLAKLEFARVDSCERDGDLFRMALKVPGALTEHVVAMPTRRQMDKHESASVKIIGARRAQEIRGFLEPTGELYDAIVKEALGYAGAVPIVHKFAVVNEIIAQLAVEDEEAIPEA
jgi:hypothetical protein